MGGSGGRGVGKGIGGRWVGMGSGGVGKFPENFPELSENSPGNFREFSGITGNFNVTLHIGRIRFRYAYAYTYTVCTKMILRL